MTDFPDLKLKAQVSFPARVDGGTGIDITKSNGSYQFDLDYSDFAPPVTSIPDATHQNALLWNSITDSYVLVPVNTLTGAITEAPLDGKTYGRSSASWVDAWASVALTGTPTAPTASPGDNDTSVATTAFVTSAIAAIGAAAVPASALPLMDSGVGLVGVSVKYAREDHIHPTDTSRAPTASPTFTGTVTAGAIVLNRAAAFDGLTINNTLSGTAKLGFYETMTATGTLGASGVNYNLINVTADNANVGGSSFGNAFTVQHTFGGAATIGGRQAIQASIEITSATNAANANRNYVAGTFLARCSSADNGSVGNEKGGMFALNPVAELKSGVAFWGNLSGGEVDIGLDSSSSTKYQLGWSVVSGYPAGSNDGAGSASFAGASFNASAIVPRTMDAAFIISDINSAWPIKTTGSLQRTVISGAVPTVVNGTDWSGVNFSGAAFKSPNFAVGGNGSVTATLCNFTANPGATGAPIVTVQNTHNTAGDTGMIIGVGPVGADSSSGLIAFKDGSLSGFVGVISRSGAGSVVYNTSSDRRLKENFRTSSVGLEDLKRINVQDFNFINEPDRDVNGFVAQELNEIYPWAVTKGGDDAKEKPWCIDHGRLTPLLVKAIQELSRQVDALNAKVQTLEGCN